MSDQGSYAVHHDFDRDVFHEEPLLGTAQWMPPAQVADRYIFEEGDLWLGRNGDDERTPIGRADDSHVLLCAKTRSGKGRALITNNLLLWPGSVFVNDPKGENASVTAARRGNGSDHATESLDQKVCVLDSHETATVDDEYRAFYNPIAEISTDDPDAESKAAIIAEACISSKDKPDPTWDNKAKTFFKTLILHIATDRFIPEEHRNMVTLRRFIVAGDFIAVEHIEQHAEPEQLKANPPDGFMLLLEGMKANMAFDGIISDQAKSLLESYARQPKMWNSIRTSAEEHSDWIDDNRIRSVLRPGKFDQTFTADELQGRDGGISVYMCLPSSMKDYFASWPRIVVNLMLMAAQTRGNMHPATGHQTLMMLDEFATMERMRRIETAAADIAGAGVKMFFVVQSLTQLKDIYGENWETFASCADTHIYYGFNDNFTAEYVSKRLGEVEIIRTTRTQSEAKNTTITDGKSKGGSSSTAENTSDARSKGGGRGTSSGGSSGSSNSTGWGPSIFFRTLATTNQFARQTGRNFGSTRQENYQRTKTKGKTKTEGTNWNESHSTAHGTTQTAGKQETIHKKPLAAINELMRLFGEVEDENDPTYPGIGLISTASRDPMLIHKCHYDQDRFFEGLFDPHPKHGFKTLPPPPVVEKLHFYLSHHWLRDQGIMSRATFNLYDNDLFHHGEAKAGQVYLTLCASGHGQTWKLDLIAPADMSMTFAVKDNDVTERVKKDHLGRVPTDTKVGLLLNSSATDLSDYFRALPDILSDVVQAAYHLSFALEDEVKKAKQVQKAVIFKSNARAILQAAQQKSLRRERELDEKVSVLFDIERNFLGDRYAQVTRANDLQCVSDDDLSIINQFR